MLVFPASAQWSCWWDRAGVVARKGGWVCRQVIQVEGPASQAAV